MKSIKILALCLCLASGSALANAAVTATAAANAAIAANSDADAQKEAKKKKEAQKKRQIREASQKVFRSLPLEAIGKCEAENTLIAGLQTTIYTAGKTKYASVADLMCPIMDAADNYSITASPHDRTYTITVSSGTSELEYVFIDMSDMRPRTLILAFINGMSILDNERTQHNALQTLVSLRSSMMEMKEGIQ